MSLLGCQKSTERIQPGCSSWDSVDIPHTVVSQTLHTDISDGRAVHLLSQGINSSHDRERRVCFVCQNVFELHSLSLDGLSSSPLRPHACVLNSNTHHHGSVTVVSQATHITTDIYSILASANSFLTPCTNQIMDFEAFNNLLGDGHSKPPPALNNGRPTRERQRTLGGKAWGKSSDSYTTCLV